MHFDSMFPWKKFNSTPYLITPIILFNLCWKLKSEMLCLGIARVYFISGQDEADEAVHFSHLSHDYSQKPRTNVWEYN